MLNTPSGSNANDRGPVFIIAQGRSGSTLLLRILNEIPGFNIAGENGGAFIYLAAFFDQLRATAEKPHAMPTFSVSKDTETKPAWYNPWVDDLPGITDHLRKLASEMFNRDGVARVWGFKEIRYGRSSEDYKTFEGQLLFLQRLFPESKFIFVTREMGSLVQSSQKLPWGRAVGLEQSRRLLEHQLDLFQQFCKCHPCFTKLLAYEDIIQGNAAFRTLFDFLGEKFEDRYLAPLAKVI